MHRSAVPRFASAAGLAVAVLATLPAAASSARSAEQPFTGFSSASGPVSIDGSQHVLGGPLQPATFTTRRTERFVTVRVIDETGMPVAAVLAEAASADAMVGGEAELARFCGATPKPVRLSHPGRGLVVRLVAGPGCSGASVPTTGRVLATFR